MKYVVVHSGNRDYYNVALSLQKNNLLCYLVTDDFFFRRKKERNDIESRLVYISYVALILKLLHKYIIKNDVLVYIKDKILSKTALKVAIKQNANLFAYSYYAYDAFDDNRFKGKKILFQVHPHPNYLKGLFEEEILLQPLSEFSLKKEHELLYSDYEFNKLCKEAFLSDFIFCASTFTKNTLVHAGVSPTKIEVIPYGVENDKFKYIERSKESNNTIKILYVGSLSQRKGLLYLNKSIVDLQKNDYNIKLFVIGRGIIDMNLISKEVIDIKIDIDVSIDSLLNYYYTSDIFIFPSLGEGFGHVILEAMATGLPVLTTINTAGADVIENKIDGYVINIRDSNQIVEIVNSLIQSPTLRLEIGRKAAVKARMYTWEKFRKLLTQKIRQFS